MRGAGKLEETSMNTLSSSQAARSGWRNWAARRAERLAEAPEGAEPGGTCASCLRFVKATSPLGHCQLLSLAASPGSRCPLHVTGVKP